LVGLPPEFPTAGLQTLTDEHVLAMSVDDLSAADPKQISADINALHWEIHAANTDLENRNLQIKAMAKELGVPYLARTDLACSSATESCAAVSSTLTKYYFDFGHITLDGAAYLSRRVDETDWFSTVIVPKI
jgi:hypothetical protein